MKSVRPTGTKEKAPPETQSILLLGISPFALSILVTFLVFLIAGNRIPRQLVPGASLALPGLTLSGLVFLAVAWVMRNRTPHAKLRKFGALLAGVCTLMSAPVWTIGVLPTVNGLATGSVASTVMHLEKLETTTVSKSRRLNHWAHLRPLGSGAPLSGGRYFVSQADYTAWQESRPRTITVNHATGLLGAETVIGFR